MGSNSADFFHDQNDKESISNPIQSNDGNTLIEFYNIPVIHEVLSDLFFKIGIKEFLDLFKQAGFPTPNFSGDFYFAACTNDPDTKELIFKVELSRFLFNNLGNRDFSSGFKKFPILIRERMLLFQQTKMMEITISDDLERINHVILKGFYTTGLEIDLPKVNNLLRTSYTSATATPEDTFLRNLQIYVLFLQSQDNIEPSGKKQALVIESVNFSPPAKTVASSMHVEESPYLPSLASTNDSQITNTYKRQLGPTNYLSSDVGTTSAPCTMQLLESVSTKISETQPSFSQITRNTLKSPLVMDNNVAVLDYSRINLKLLRALISTNTSKFTLPSGSLDSLDALRDYFNAHVEVQVAFINFYMTSRMNITQVHISVGKVGAVQTMSTINGMGSWPPTMGQYLVFTNLPVEVQNDEKFAKKLIDWCLALGISVHIVNQFLGEFFYSNSRDSVGQQTTCMIVLPIIQGVTVTSRLCTTFCIQEHLVKHFPSYVGVNIIDSMVSFNDPFLFIDGLTQYEAPFLQMKVKHVLQQVLSRDLIVILNPHYTQLTVNNETFQHVHMLLAVYCKTPTTSSDTLYNVLNLTKPKVQSLIVDGRELLMAKAIDELVKRPFPQSLKDSVPSAHVCFNVSPSVTVEQATACILGCVQPTDIFIIPSSITADKVDIHYVLPADIPTGERLVVNSNLLPFTPPFRIITGTIKYSQPSIDSKGNARKHNPKKNHFLWNSVPVANPVRGNPSSSKK